nr:MAG TPA: hypothetical protein [Caudoviricetes sp.]
MCLQSHFHTGFHNMTKPFAFRSRILMSLPL